MAAPCAERADSCGVPLLRLLSARSYVVAACLAFGGCAAAPSVDAVIYVVATLLLYTSTRVSPVANTAVTKIITDTAPMAAPVMTSASCSGSSLEKALVVKCCEF